MKYWDGFCKFRRSFFFNCGSILTFGIRIANSGDSLPRNGLYNVYIVVIKNTCFFWVVLKDSVFIKSNAIISYDSSISEKGLGCIPKWLASFFCCYFSKIQFFSIFCHIVAFAFFIFISQEVLDLDLFILCLLNSFVINRAWLSRTFHLFCRACLSVSSLEVLVNSS